MDQKVKVYLTLALLVPSLAFGQEDDRPVVVQVPDGAFLAVTDKDPGRSKVIELPAGYFIPEASWDQLDEQVKSVQRSNIALIAENQHLKKEVDSALSAKPSSVKLLLVTFAFGLAVGAGAVIVVKK